MDRASLLSVPKDDPEQGPSSFPLLTGGQDRLPTLEDSRVLSLPPLPPPPKGSWWWGAGSRFDVRDRPQGGQWRGSLLPFSLPKRKRLKGPLRAARLCLLSILLPAILLTIPLYLRHRVYGRREAFPLAASDMRIIDSHISTTWCQRQVVEANATFNAFLVPETPQVEEEPQRMTMHRSIYLGDDMKEYWGFYLLKGSTVSLSACARWPGASLIVIKGHRHLRECAYIGQKSSEESDEMMLVEGESEMNQTQGGRSDNVVKNGHSRRVIFNEKLTWKPAKAILKNNESLPTNTEATEKEKTLPPPPDDTVETSAEVYDDILRKILQMGDRGKRVLERLSSRVLIDEDDIEEKKSASQTSTQNKDQINGLSADESLLRKIIHQLVKESWERERSNTKRKSSQSSNNNKKDMKTTGMIGDVPSTTEGTSMDIKKKLDDSQVKNTSREKYSKDVNKKQPDDDAETIKEADAILKRARRAILAKNLELPNIEEDQGTEHISEEIWEGLEEGHVPKRDGIADDRGTIDHWDPNDRSRSEFWSSFSSSEEALLVCDGLVLYMPLTPHLGCSHNETLTKLRQRNAYDEKQKTEGRHGPTETSSSTGEERDNTLSYQIPANGYYFFVFNSENEVQTNFIHVHFDLRRRVYKIKDSIVECHNTSHCELPLSFFSDQKVVLEMPMNQGDTNHSETLLINGQLAASNQTADSASTNGSLSTKRPPTTAQATTAELRSDKNGNYKAETRVEGGESLLWDESYVVVTTCQPRNSIYICLIISVPLLILLFAFQ